MKILHNQYNLPSINLKTLESTIMSSKTKSSHKYTSKLNQSILTSQQISITSPFAKLCFNKRQNCLCQYHRFIRFSNPHKAQHQKRQQLKIRNASYKKLIGEEMRQQSKKIRQKIRQNNEKMNKINHADKKNNSTNKKNYVRKSSSHVLRFSVAVTNITQNQNQNASINTHNYSFEKYMKNREELESNSITLLKKIKSYLMIKNKEIKLNRQEYYLNVILQNNLVILLKHYSLNQLFQMNKTEISEKDRKIICNILTIDSQQLNKILSHFQQIIHQIWQKQSIILSRQKFKTQPDQLIKIKKKSNRASLKINDESQRRLSKKTEIQNNTLVKYDQRYSYSGYLQKQKSRNQQLKQDKNDQLNQKSNEQQISIFKPKASIFKQQAQNKQNDNIASNNTTNLNHQNSNKQTIVKVLGLQQVKQNTSNVHVKKILQSKNSIEKEFSKRNSRNSRISQKLSLLNIFDQSSKNMKDEIMARRKISKCKKGVKSIEKINEQQQNCYKYINRQKLEQLKEIINNEKLMFGQKVHQIYKLLKLVNYEFKQQNAELQQLFLVLNFILEKNYQQQLIKILEENRMQLKLRQLQNQIDINFMKIKQFKPDDILEEQTSRRQIAQIIKQQKRNKIHNIINQDKGTQYIKQTNNFQAQIAADDKNLILDIINGLGIKDSQALRNLYQKDLGDGIIYQMKDNHTLVINWKQKNKKSIKKQQQDIILKYDIKQLDMQQKKRIFQYAKKNFPEFFNKLIQDISMYN